MPRGRPKGSKNKKPRAKNGSAGKLRSLIEFGTPQILVPPKMAYTDKKGNVRVVNTLTRSGGLSTHNKSHALLINDVPKLTSIRYVPRSANKIKHRTRIAF